MDEACDSMGDGLGTSRAVSGDDGKELVWLGLSR